MEEDLIFQFARFIISKSIANLRNVERPFGETKICSCCNKKYDSGSYAKNPSGFPHKEDCLYKKAQAVLLLAPEKNK